jgi:shikimate kinase
MSLVYITGPTGSGKSTICQKLHDLGYESYDTDKEGIRYWLDPKTKEPIKVFKKGDPEWFKEYKLGLPKDWLENLKSNGAQKPVFVCGTSPIDHTDSNLYNAAILLKIDEGTLIKRLADRDNSQYGKSPEQLKKAIKWRQGTIDRYRKTGAYEIDGTLSLNKVINQILAITSRLV